MKRATPRDAKGRFVKKARRNLDAFVKGGVIHPIRKSKDYDPKKAGERESKGRAGPHGIRRTENIISFTRSGKAVGNLITGVTRSTVTVREGLDGSGTEHQYPASALRALRTGARPVIDPYGTGR